MKPFLVRPAIETGAVTFHGFFRAPEVLRGLQVLVEKILGVQSVEIWIEAPPPSLFDAK